MSHFQRTTEFVQRVLAMLPNQIYVFDVIDERVVYSNHATQGSLSGYLDDELRALPSGDIWTSVHPEDVEQVRARVQTIIATGAAQHDIEYRIRRKNGVYIWVLGNMAPLEYDDAGRVTQIIGTSVDITERKLAEEAARQMAETLRYQASLLDNVLDAVISTDAQFRVVSWNTAAEQLYGWRADEAIGRPFGDLVPNSYVNGLTNDEVAADLLENGHWRGEAIQQRRDGREIHVLASVTKLVDDADNFIGALGINRDISERKRNEEALRRQAERLKLLNQVERSILDAESPEKMYATVLRHTRQLLNAHRVSILLFDEEAQQGNLFAADTDPSHNIVMPRITPLPGNLETLKQQGIIVLGDIAQIENPDMMARQLAEQGIHGMINAVLMVQGQAIGSLNASSLAVDAFSDEHVEIMSEIANQLAVAIQQARMTEQMRIYTASLEEQVAQRSAELEMVINSIPDHIYVLERESQQIRFCNTVFATGAGLASTHEGRGKRAVDLFAPGDASRSNIQNEQVWATGETLHEQEIVHLPDGLHHFDTYKVPLKKADGTIYALISTSRDITPIVQLQEQLSERTAELEALMNTLPDQIWLIGRDHKHLYGNNAFAEFNDLSSRHEVTGKSYEELFEASEAQAFAAEDEKTFATGEPIHKRETIVRNGELYHLDTYMIPLHKADGTVYALIGTARDITPIIRLQEELSERTVELEALMNTLPDLIWTIGRNHKHLYCNDGFAEAIGLSGREAIRGKGQVELFGEEAGGAYAREDEQIFQAGETVHKQETMPIKGEVRHFDTYKIPLKKRDGTVYALLGATRDITPIIELQQQLSERTTELEVLMNTMPDQIWVVDKQSGTYLYCNDHFAEDYNQGNREGVRGKTAFDLHGPEKGEIYTDQNTAVMETGTALHLRQFSQEAGEMHYYDTYKIPLKKPDGTVYAMLGTSRDITPLVRLQEQLTERTTVLETLMNNIPDYVWVVDRDHRFQYANKQYIENVGPAEEGRSIIELYQRDNIQVSIDENNTVFSTKKTMHMRTERVVDGESVWFDTFKIPLFRPDGSVYALIGTARDITPVVRLQEQLTERTIELESVMNAVPDHIWITNKNGDVYQYGNDSMARELGVVDRTNLHGKTPYDFFAPEVASFFISENRAVLATGESKHKQEAVTLPDGRQQNFDTYLIPLKKLDGTVYAMLGTSRDITPIIRLQEQLAERTAELEGLMNAIPDFIWVVEPGEGDRFIYRYGNITFARGLGLTDYSEASGKTPHDLYPTGVADRFVEEYRKLFATGEVYHKQDEDDLIDGEHHFFDTYLIPMKHADGQVYAVIGTARDITPIVSLQDQLVERTAELETLIDSVPDYIWIMEAATQKFIYGNTGFLRAVGLGGLREIQGKTVFDLFPPELAQNYQAINQEIVTSGQTLHKLETTTITSGAVTLDEYLIPVKTPDGRVTKIIGTSRDITPIIELQQRLTERTLELEGVMNAVPDYIWVYSRAERAYTYCNDGFAQASGYERATDLIGKSELEIFPQPRAGRYTEENWRVLETGETIHKQEDVPMPFGIRTLDIYLIPLKLPDGTVHGLVGTARDITPLIELQTKLNERTIELETLINTIPDHIWVIERDTHQFLYANERYTQYIGLKNNASINGLTKHDFYPRYIADRFAAEDVQVFETGQIFHSQEVTKRNGEAAHWDTYKMPLRRPDGSVYALLGAARDITETVVLQQELSERTAELEALMNAVPDHIWMIGPGGDHYTYVNAAYARDLHLNDPAEARGRKLADFHPAEDTQRYIEANKALFVSGEMSHYQDTTVLLDGKPRTFDIFVVPLRKLDNTVYALLGISRDITSIIDLQNQLMERGQALEAANHELEAFAYSVSHDLRTPLRSINGFSHALLHNHAECLDETGHMLLDKVYDSSVRMGTLIDDLLTLSQITQTEMRREPVDLTALAHSIIGDLRQADPARQVNVSIAEGLRTRGDGNLLRLALANLLENAWKFTSKTPDARIEVGSNAPNTFYVRDNGAGFDMTYAERLFRAFHRLHTAGEFPGTGIGLATVERIIHRHGGRVWAVSQMGEGATFYFEV